MKSKKMLFIGVLIFITSVNATPPSFSKTCYTTNLSESLSSDNDFKDYTFKNYYFLSKIKQTNSGSLFKKIIENKASETEKNVFAKTIGFSSNNVLNEFMKEMFEKKASFQRRFPEIQNNQQSKDEVYNAIKLVLNNTTTLKTDQDCLILFMSLGTICNSTCYLINPENWEQCFNECMYWASFDVFMCYLLAEPA